MREQIATELRKARIWQDFTIDEMTSKCGLSHVTIRKIERAYPVKWDSVEAYAKSLGYLLTFKLEPNETNDH